MVIALVGMRGSGKTSVGRMLAARLGLRFIDTDAEVELRAGCTTNEMFASGRVADFRAIEAVVVAGAVAGGPAVVATGGGVVEDPTSAALLSGVFTVWLTAPPHTLLARCAGSDRPPLTNLDSPLEFETLLARRAPLYAACAKVVVSTDGRSVEDVCEEVALAAAATREVRNPAA